MDNYVYLHDPATGHSYYADTVTGTTSWERPVILDEPPTSAAVVIARRESFAVERRKSRSKVAAKWVEYFDDAQGLPYYYNEATGESVWVLPADDDDDDGVDEDMEPGAAEEETAQREKVLKHRARILEEIESTERSYVDSLHVLMKVYLHPLRMVADVPRGAIFTHDDLDAIFLNIELITKVNEQFLSDLVSGRAVADALKAAARQFKGCYARCARTAGGKMPHVLRRRCCWSRTRAHSRSPRAPRPRGVLDPRRREQLRRCRGEASKDPRISRAGRPREASLPDECHQPPRRQGQGRHLVSHPACAARAALPAAPRRLAQAHARGPRRRAGGARRLRARLRARAVL